MVLMIDKNSDNRHYKTDVSQISTVYSNIPLYSTSIFYSNSISTLQILTVNIVFTASEELHQ